ncbi:SMP-30/gluconolactonase/LRE family protein [Stakelama saccharophila]|uniref:SMP-30/gluconolactonase/LRE family protein n=1 Tax=Stakelama saccharophila TaxID=3075605 RepID=A0ABZ0BD90_9SPHN|nr:SMP-30/gluconolactonase/LRE family protein [Stakelama sp. W311]WNO54686.1 SMP-30/gluconolactonase/LRE family protein [Stakelama sp. W311]
MQLDRRNFMAGAAMLAASPALAAEGRASVRRLSPKLDAIIDPAAAIDTIATGIRWAEGPVWLRNSGCLLFSDPPANMIRRWSPADGASRFLWPSGVADPDPATIREPGSNGMAYEAAGTVMVADSGMRALTRLDPVSREKLVLVGHYRGKRFNSPNDLCIARSGAVYFTDPPYGLIDGDDSPLKELGFNGVYRWSPDGEVLLIDGDLSRPNGVALSPDERRLYVSVSDEQAPRIMAYDLDARGGAVARRVFFDAKPLMGSDAPGLPDGMKVAADGTLFCSAPGGMWILTPEAEPLGRIEAGRAIPNCCFGESGATLFLTATDRVLRLPLRINGWRR